MARYAIGLYTPQDVQDPGGVVLLHGVHHLGIDDPRCGTWRERWPALECWS